jgi:hypothetical protein
MILPLNIGRASTENATSSRVPRKESDVKMPSLPGSGSVEGGHARLALALGAFTACYLPFLRRPIQIDDPLFLWAARHIQSNPLDFYGLSANWFGTVAPFPDVMQNPPLVSYWLAAWTAIFGWTEVSLHLAMLPWALGALAGIWFLARELDAPPTESLLVAAATPAFFVSSTTLMCDVPQLCSWTWATVFWIRGIRTGRNGPMAWGATLAAVAFLTKYVGIGLVPLFAAYGAIARRRAGPWLAWLALPVAVVVGYELLTSHLYGRGLFLGASRYAIGFEGKAAAAIAGKITSGLAFTGGAFLVVLWYAPRLWTGRALAGWTALGVLLASGVAWGRWLDPVPLQQGGPVRWAYLFQVGALAAIGAGILWLVVAEAIRERSADGMLLLLWAAGIVAFAFWVNWSLNVRSLLPMLPVVAILVVRRATRRADSAARSHVVRQVVPLAAGAATAMLVAAADCRLAEISRDSAVEIGQQLRAAGKTARFQGHWGFQWYAEQQGMVALDWVRHPLHAGELHALPGTNSNLNPIREGTAATWTVLRAEPFPWLATMGGTVGAGFYADAFGPLPFVVGPIPTEWSGVIELLPRPQ